MKTPTIALEDGRRARRLRNRDAVVDALFELLTEGRGVPGIEAIAARAGVSVSSIFRYFDGLDDLQRETLERYFTRFADLFEIPELGIGSPPDRIEHFVRARLRLYDTIAPIARLARARAYDDPLFEQSLTRARATFVEQVRRQFAPEIAADPGETDDLVALIDSLCSFESWDLQRSSLGRTNASIARTWMRALGELLNT